MKVPKKIYNKIRGQYTKKKDELMKRTYKENENLLSILINQSLLKEINILKYSKVVSYLESLFPEVDVTSPRLYLCEEKAFDINYNKNASGVYLKSNKCIIIKNYKKSKIDSFSCSFEIDEVLVHELLHYIRARILYGANAWGNTMRGHQVGSVDLDEEFAHGFSVGYFVNKGLSDQEIIKQKMLAYLSTRIDTSYITTEILKNNNVTKEQYLKAKDKNSKLAQRIDKEYEEKARNYIRREAVELGKKILSIYKEKIDMKLTSENGDDKIGLDL